MADPLITLTTDFGSGSHYVAAAKGVILALNPEVRIVDLCHDIPAQDLRQTAFFLSSTLPYFPPEALHVVIVDPGVGSKRPILYVELANLRLIVPDNGCWTWLIDGARRTAARHPSGRATLLAQQNQSHLSRPRHLRAGGRQPQPRTRSAQLGPIVTDWMRLDRPAPREHTNGIAGEVLYVDHFGNLITNIPGETLTLDDRPKHVHVDGIEIHQIVHTYSDASPGTLVALVSSSEWLEISITQGNAAQQLGASLGTPVTLDWDS